MAHIELSVLVLLTGATLMACGDATDRPDEAAPAGDGTSLAITDRGGPDSLVGEAWRSEPMTLNGIALQLSFAFSADELTATSTCNGALSVSTTTPVRYRYRAQVVRPAQNEVQQGQASCFAEIAQASFALELDGEGLLLKDPSGNETRFAPSGNPNGIYGTWFVETSEFRLEWSMGEGKIRARNTCKANNLSVTTEAETRFENLLEIVETRQDSIEEGGLRCDVAIEAGTFTYTIDDRAITLVDANGNAIAFAR